jgi:hypothetical protein
VKYYAAWPYRLITSTQAEPPATVTTFDAVDAKSHPEVLLSRFNVTQVRGSQLVDMTFDSADPQFAARAANAFADEYVAHNLELKVQTLNTSADWLTGEVQKQADLVRESDLKLAQYKETQDAVSLDSNQNIVVARLTQNNDAATKARMDRIQKEGLWRQIQAAGDDVESITSVLNNQNIQTLRVQLNQAGAGKVARHGAVWREASRVPEGRDRACQRRSATQRGNPQGQAERQERVRQRRSAGTRDAGAVERRQEAGDVTRPQGRGLCGCCCAKRNPTARFTTSW